MSYRGLDDRCRILYCALSFLSKIDLTEATEEPRLTLEPASGAPNDTTQPNHHVVTRRSVSFAETLQVRVYDRDATNPTRDKPVVLGTTKTAATTDACRQAVTSERRSSVYLRRLTRLEVADQKSVVLAVMEKGPPHKDFTVPLGQPLPKSLQEDVELERDDEVPDPIQSPLLEPPSPPPRAERPAASPATSPEGGSQGPGEERPEIETTPPEGGGVINRCRDKVPMASDLGSAEGVGVGLGAMFRLTLIHCRFIFQSNSSSPLPERNLRNILWHRRGHLPTHPSRLRRALTESRG